MTSRSSVPSRTAAMMQFALLLVLLGLAFRGELRQIFLRAHTDVDWSHVFAAPVVVLLMLALRRERFASAEVRPSWTGAVLLFLGVAGWLTFNPLLKIAYLAGLCLIVAMIGAIVAAAGWAHVRAAAPALLALALCVPIGTSEFERRTLSLQHASLRAADWTLSALPRLDAQISGTALKYTYAGQEGWIGLGVPRNGARLLVTIVFLAVVLAYVRRRPTWQIAFIAALALPVMLIGNVFRLIIYGLATVYGHAPPTASWPREVSYVATVLLALALLSLPVVIAAKLIEIAQPEPEEESHA
jgi:exosortase/archaeosortase family protein